MTVNRWVATGRKIVITYFVSFHGNPTIFSQITSNFHYTLCIAQKRVTNGGKGPIFASLFPGMTLSSSKRRSDGEPLATLRTIWPARDLDLRPSARQANAFSPKPHCTILYCSNFAIFLEVKCTDWSQTQQHCKENMQTNLSSRLFSSFVLCNENTADMSNFQNGMGVF